jgi:hypothetical protein
MLTHTLGGFRRIARAATGDNDAFLAVPARRTVASALPF